MGEWKAQKGIQTNCADPTDNHTFAYTDGCYKDAGSGITTCITIAFTKDGKYINIYSGHVGPENWWDEVKSIAKEKLGEKFDPS